MSEKDKSREEGRMYERGHGKYEGLAMLYNYRGDGIHLAEANDCCLTAEASLVHLDQPMGLSTHWVCVRVCECECECECVCGCACACACECVCVRDRTRARLNSCVV